AGTSGNRLGAGSAAVASRGGRKGPQAPEERGRGDAGKGSPTLVDRPGALSPGGRGRSGRRSCVARGKAVGGSTSPSAADGDASAAGRARRRRLDINGARPEGASLAV